LTIYRA